jgi:hypothetical protein
MIDDPPRTESGYNNPRRKMTSEWDLHTGHDGSEAADVDTWLGYVIAWGQACSLQAYAK